MVDGDGKRRVVLFSGLFPVRSAISEDDGENWSELTPIGEWGGIVTMSSVIERKTGRGHYLALFHDDGLYFANSGRANGVFTLYRSLSGDGGSTWSTPQPIHRSDVVHLCEPGAFRSPDGKQIAVLLRENRRVKNSHVIFSDDEGETWTQPREVPDSLRGDRHVAKYGPDGRLFISFRDAPPKHLSSPTAGDWVGWVGTYEDIVDGRDGQFRVRFENNHHGWDCAYPGVEVLPNGTFVVTTYGHWTPQEHPDILSVRFTMAELDELSKVDGTAGPAPSVPEETPERPSRSSN
ncbi:MAG: exo-alpha-sialidase [Planctomycetes bacterium]|nr:exo-alpha-sialidase [Planctomycetota bacterium]